MSRIETCRRQLEEIEKTRISFWNLIGERGSGNARFDNFWKWFGKRIEGEHARTGRIVNEVGEGETRYMGVEAGGRVRWLKVDEGFWGDYLEKIYFLWRQADISCRKDRPVSTGVVELGGDCIVVVNEGVDRRNGQPRVNIAMPEEGLSYRVERSNDGKVYVYDSGRNHCGGVVARYDKEQDLGRKGVDLRPGEIQSLLRTVDIGEKRRPVGENVCPVAAGDFRNVVRGLRVRLQDSRRRF